MAEKRRFWRFTRFSLRTLIVLCLICGVAVPMYISRVLRQRRAVAAIRSVGGSVEYASVALGQGILAATEARLRKVVGPDWYLQVTSVSLPESFDLPGYTFDLDSRVLPQLRNLPGLETLSLGVASDKRLAHIEHLNALRRLDIWHSSTITDKGLNRLRTLERLEELRIASSFTTDEGLSTIGRLPRLEVVEIGGNEFTDRGLLAIANSRELRVLKVWSYEGRFTDVGISALKGLASLERVALNRTFISSRGVDDLATLPALRVLVLADAAPSEVSYARNTMRRCKVSSALTNDW